MDKIKVLRSSIFCKMERGWGAPLVLIGPPGTAKTALCEQIAKSLKVPYYCLSPGEQGEGAFGVVPVPDKGYLTYPAPCWVKDFDQGILNIDEITTAPPFLQAPLLGLLLAKRIGGAQLSPNVRIIGTGNPAWMVSGSPIGVSLQNRFCQIEWEPPTLDEFASFHFGLKQEISSLTISEEEGIVNSQWNATYASTSGEVLAFLERRPDLKNQCPQEGEEVKPWPSDRSWSLTMRLLASSRIQGCKDDDQLSLVGGCVGYGAASEFFTFIKNMDLPSPKDIFLHREEITKPFGFRGWEHDQSRMDLTIVVLRGMVSFLMTLEKNKEKYADVLWDILKYIPEKDLTIKPAKDLIAAGLHKTPAARKTLAALKGILMEISNV